MRGLAKPCRMLGGLVAVAVVALAPPAGAALSHFGSRVVDDSGAAVAEASVRVTAIETPRVLASLFADATGTMPLANPLTTDGTGAYEFYVASGSYDIAISSSTFATTLVGVGIVDPGVPHVEVGNDATPPITLVESSDPAAGGNAALLLERRRADGSRVAGPWSLRVNQGSDDTPGRHIEMRWLYNVDWNEQAHASGPLVTADQAFALRVTAPGPLPPFDACLPYHDNTQFFDFGFDRAPAGAAGASPAWSTLLSAQAQGDRIVRVAGGPLVVGDGLAGSSLVARRVGWVEYRKPGPAGVLDPIDGGVTTQICSNPPLPIDISGAVAVPAPNPTYFDSIAVVPTTKAQPDASVQLEGGNGLPVSLLSVGKALVSLENGVTVQRGDVIVSSGAQPGRATVDNTVTHARPIIGFAIERGGETLPGYVAILRTSR